MQIKFYNSPEPEAFNSELISDVPKFVSYKPDFVLLQKYADKYKNYKNFIVIGHGGSVTSFMAIYQALQNKFTKPVYFLSTIDPVRIEAIKSMTSPDQTLVIAISKSGETVTQIEALSQFLDYPLLAITGAVGPLATIAERLNADMIIHPNIGGRFTGLTEVALLPSLLCGFDIQKIYEGGSELYQSFVNENGSYKLSSVLYKLEEQGIVDVFLPLYSSSLTGFENLIVQLCHESFGKNGHGQTYFAFEAPESQHHTNQRLFGGRKNLALCVLSVKELATDLSVSFPDSLLDINLKDKTLGEVLQNSFLNQAMHFERDGVIETAKRDNLPVIDFQVENLNPKSIGQLIAFWQMFAVYSSVLRDVNPYDQPEVEDSKNLSFAKRLASKNII